MTKQIASFEAHKTEQAGTILYVGIGTAKKLIACSTVDHYNPALPPTDKNQGYQRPPERSRLTKIGNFLIGQNGGVVFPTAVLLASRKPLEYDRKNNMLNIFDDEQLQIVDGQHRLYGLKYAIEEKNAVQLENYPIPFVIMETSNKLDEMTNFRIVNGTAKSVRTDLVNMILTATYANTKRPDVPKKDQWRIVVSNVVDRLSKDASSPWHDAIILPGEPIVKRN
jgi:DGQHR domain-containing protein